MAPHAASAWGWTNVRVARFPTSAANLEAEPLLSNGQPELGLVNASPLVAAKLLWNIWRREYVKYPNGFE